MSPLRPFRCSIIAAAIAGCCLVVLTSNLHADGELATAGAYAAESTANVDTALADLQARLTAVEQQNRELVRRLESDSPNGIASNPANVDSPTDAINPLPAYSEVTPADAIACPPGEQLPMWARWNYGLELQSADKKFRVHVGGRTQLDAVWLQNSPAFDGAGGAGDEDAVDFRRARLRVDGTMYEIIDWAAEYDFANSTNDNVGLQPASDANVTAVTGITDLWINISQIPAVGNIRVGQMKEPIGMEHLTSSRFLEFMERSFNQDAFTGAFTNGFSPGFMFWNTYNDEHGIWATGFFKNTANFYGYGVGDGEYAWTSRVTCLPWYEEEGAELLHLGVSGSLRDPNNGLVRYRARPSLRNGPAALNPILADTGNFAADSVAMAGAEAAANFGALNIQSEYMASYNDDATLAGNNFGSEMYYGWYVEALYFLTGEHRNYDRRAGVFGRVIPNENFDMHGGLGAWQLGVRYSRLDLDDSIDGGDLHDVTIGLNWFLNPNLKLQSNYVITERNAPGQTGDGTIQGFGMRLASDF